MTHDNGNGNGEPRHLLVRAQGDRSPLYASNDGLFADTSGFVRNVPVDHPALGLTHGDLARQLTTWSESRPPVGSAARPALREHVKKGLETAQAPARYLGPTWAVRYWDERHGTTKFACWGCLRPHWTLDPHDSPRHPLHITVEGEYKWHPLRAEGFGDFAPDDQAAALGLSEELVADLYAWAAEIDAAMETWLRNRDDAELEAAYERLRGDGSQLAERLGRELGPGRTVTYRGLQPAARGLAPAAQ
ncbi:hypothetical protein AB0I22_08300 [Streptomyces sp. NPDC050610]|uniref:hypothetical protein n=1 Tax=Streptomyces sp. NPDC050610 TaxID=3157097 RepID=UPI0034153CC8